MVCFGEYFSGNDVAIAIFGGESVTMDCTMPIYALQLYLLQMSEGDGVWRLGKLEWMGWLVIMLCTRIRSLLVEGACCGWRPTFSEVVR